MTDLNELQKQIKAIADVVNAFKSEAVQLRVVEALLGQLGAPPAHVGSPPAPPPAKPAQRRKASKRAAASATPSVAVAATPKSDKPTRKASARSSSSPGAFAMISQLQGDGFFRSPQTISAIVKHCGTSKGHHYRANECSPALLRLLRDGKLTRQKNKDGQYEYTQA